MNYDKTVATPEEEVPHMKSLSACINRMTLDGYTENFKMEAEGLRALSNNNLYQPGQVEVANFFRFEGQSDPNDNTILYVLETNDGLKGTLVDAYGPYADEQVSEFFKKIESFQKKVNKERD